LRAEDLGPANSSLFLLACPEGWLPSRGLLTWRCGNDLDLLLFGFFGLPITSLLAFGHVDLLGVNDAGIGCGLDEADQKTIAASAGFELIEFV
jgi:hypothetical protein